MYCAINNTYVNHIFCLKLHALEDWAQQINYIDVMCYNLISKEKDMIRERSSQHEEEVILHEISESLAGWFYYPFSFSTQLILLGELGLAHKRRFSSLELRRSVEAAQKKNPYVQHAKVVEFDPKKQTPIPFSTFSGTCVSEIGVNGLVYLCREYGAWVLKYTAQAKNEDRDERWSMPHHTPAHQIKDEGAGFTHGLVHRR